MIRWKDISKMSYLKENKCKIIIIAVFSLCMAVLFRIYSQLGLWLDIIGNGLRISTLFKFIFGNWQIWLICVGFIVITSLFVFCRRIRDFVYKYRYVFASVIFVLCVICEITGSSIGSLCDKYGVEDKDLIFGFSRLIRTDEYSVTTPFFFGQSLSESGNAFEYFSDFANGYESDLYMGVRQPIKHVLTVFRPFTLGFLFLSPEKGLSFWWCGKLIVLFMATFEMGMLLTDKRKTLSLIMSILITFSPIVQWWFSTSAGEIIIYTEIAMLLFNKYLSEKRLWVRMLLLVGILFLAGCFVMLLYPSWQVPFVYVILLLTAWIIIINRKQIALKWYDYTAIAGGLLGIALVFLYIFNKSADTLELIGNTVYPGERMETGGGWGEYIFAYPFNTWFTVTKFEFNTHNICEMAFVFDFFPLSIVLPILVMIKNRKHDLLSIMLLCINVLFGIWIIWGFPEIIAKITFLSNSQANRTLFAWGFVNILLLIRSVSLIKDNFKTIQTIGICALLTSSVMIFVVKLTAESIIASTGRTIFVALIAITFIVVFGGMFVLINYNRKNMSLVALCLICVTAMVCGVMVNPVRAGVDSVYEVPLIHEIENIETDDEKDIWAIECSEMDGYQYANIALMSGVKIINSTEIYPNMELWNRLDSTGRYNDVYNRYAHVGIVIKKSGEPVFELVTTDSFVLYITFEDLQKIGVTYVAGMTNLDEYASSASCKVKKISYNNGIYIYRIE